MCKVMHEESTDENSSLNEDLYINCYGKHKKQPIKILTGLYKGHYSKFILSGIFFALKHSCVWVLPIVTANIINIALKQDESGLNKIIFNLIVILALVALNIPMNYLYTKCRSRAVRDVEAGLRGAMVRKLQQLSMSYHTEMQSGRLQSKIMRDVESIETLSQQLFINTLTIGLNIIVALSVTLFKSRIVFLFFLISAPIAAFTIVGFKSKIKKSNSEFRKEMEETSARVMEMVELIPVTRAHALEKEEIKNIFSEYRKEAESLSTPKEVAMLETSLSVLNDKKSTQDELNKAQSTLNSLLGTEISNQDELNKKVNERIRLLKASAEADFYVNKGLTAQDEINSLYSKYGGAEKMDEKLRLRGTFSALKKGIGIDSQIDRDYARIQELQKVVADAGWKVDAAVRAGVDLSGGGGSKSQYTPSAGGESKKKDKNAPDDIKGFSGLYELQKVIEANKHKIKPISGGVSMVGYDPRDTTFDYKKSESDMLEEEYGQLEKYIQRLREEGKVAMEEIWKEEQKLTSLSDALKLSKLKEDIQEMNLSIFEQSIDGVTGFADALDRAARSWSRIANEDMSGFERMVSIINAIGDTIKGLMGTWEAYTTLRDLISTKEQAIQAKDNILNAQKIANVSTLAAVEQGAALASLATKSTEVAANTTVAASGAAASVAGIPLVGPMLAVGAVASILGLLGGLPKFADGGIFAGLKGGDRNLARLNGGEMIMTTPQQSKLWGAIKNGDFGGIGGKVEFEIKGKKLVGVLGNQSKRSARV